MAILFTEGLNDPIQFTIGDMMKTNEIKKRKNKPGPKKGYKKVGKTKFIALKKQVDDQLDKGYEIVAKMLTEFDVTGDKIYELMNNFEKSMK